MFTLYWIAFHVGWCSIVWTVSNGAHRTGTSLSYTSNIVPEPFKVRVWWTNSCSLLMNICFRFSGLQSSFLLIHFREGLNTWFTPHHSLTQKLFDMPTLHLRDWPGATSRWNPRWCEWLKPYPVWFSYRRKRYPVLCEHSRQLLPTARTELGQWQGEKRGAGSRSVLPARFRAMVSFASVLSFQPVNTNFSRRTRCWVGTGSCGQFRRILYWS